jgi:hypothetical protein
VVIPTFRGDDPEVVATIEQVKRSLTEPTDFLLLDGTPGKAVALQRALETYGDPEKYDLWVTVDDDIELPENWQHFIDRAFAVIPGLGAAGIDLTDTPEGCDLIIESLLGPVEQLEDVMFRSVTVHNLVGICIAMPMVVAFEVGNYVAPARYGLLLPAGEDGWRSNAVKARGLKLVYVVTPGKVRLRQYQDRNGYRERKIKAYDELAELKRQGLL